MADAVSIQTNVDLTERQIQVNEWTYNDKMETLFMFQLLFFGLVVIIFFAILSKYGFFRYRLVWAIGVVIGMVVGIIGLTRHAYTRNIRDKEFWSKRYFNGDGALDPAVPAADVAAAAQQKIALCQAAKAGGVISTNC